MGNYFSDAVELSLRYLFYEMSSGRGQEAFQLLEQASNAGDGDATALLARCFCGYQYMWRGHGFPEDDRQATHLMHKAVEQGSALGVLLALRSGELSSSMRAKMPFTNLKEAFDIVLKKAEQGEPFCQYTVGNVYFWWDFLEIFGRDPFPGDRAASDAYMRENIAKCEGWFLKSFQNGVYYAGNNLNRYYTQGDDRFIAPQPQKAEGIWRMGAEHGYPVHQYIYAKELHGAGQKEEAFQWFRQAAEGGEADAWFYVGLAYEEGKFVPKDCRYAVECYEKGIEGAQNTGCFNRLGALYYKGEEVEQDYEKAFPLLLRAYQDGSTWGVFYLGKCCFYGLGTPRDFVKAREFLEQVNWNNLETQYMLGTIYCQGLGVPEDIKRGVELLKKAESRQEARDELAKYKRTLFGKWIRR
ncbi:MAG: sel1 repeat family protein [Lachnospiraceae bacterium]|jgi:TPR repeat protein|nr:sel1 repeat family protein [Lachnospiraceae bacterium]